VSGSLPVEEKPVAPPVRFQRLTSAFCVTTLNTMDTITLQLKAMSAQLDGMDARLDQMNTRLKLFDARFDQQDLKLQRIEESQDAIANLLVQIRADLKK
jgi:septal ring factor EnvC (AmiA/AmiB activator)